MTTADRKPLAEGQWLWRRLYVYGVSLVLWGLLALVVARAGPEALPRIARDLMGLLALVLVLYLVAPTAEQLTAIVANLRLRLAAGRG